MTPYKFLVTLTESRFNNIKKDIAKAMIDWMEPLRGVYEDKDLVNMYFADSETEKPHIPLFLNSKSNRHKFFDKHYLEITKLIEIYIEVEKQNITISSSDIKSIFANWAYANKLINIEYDINKQSKKGK